MAQIEIPEEWRKAVCAVLSSGSAGHEIRWTDDATRRFEADSNGGWSFEAHDAFRAFLTSANPTGCHVTMGTPPGETYEFYFPFKNTTFYGKILLRADRKRIIAFSAHRPLKSKLSCE